jgi:hypothetical protein
LVQSEPSPIEVELIAPAQAGPGSVIQVRINYDAVDTNAGADLNYNVFGPAHIRKRDPEPPNPLVNTWVPDARNSKGTIQIELQVDEGSEGQEIEHQVEVRWGIKASKYSSRTQVKAVPPTATPTVRPSRPAQAPPTPTAVPTTAANADFRLTDVAFLDASGEPLSSAEADQGISLQGSYQSSADLEDLQIEIRFEPNVVELEDVQWAGDAYRLTKAVLPAAEGETPLFESPLQGRILAHTGGGSEYTLRALVRLIPGEEATWSGPQEASSAPLRVTQSVSLKVGISTETQAFRAGESFVVHLRCENSGAMPASQVRLALAGLPPTFVVSPEEQWIDRIAEGGGVEQRLVTVRTPDDWDGPVTFRAVADMDGLAVRSESLSVQVVTPAPLRLDASASAERIYAGDVVYVSVSAFNEGPFVAEEVTARLIDTTGNLGVLVKAVGDVDVGESHEWVFVVDVPEDFPADVESSLVVQAISGEGVTSESEQMAVAIACRPRLEVSAEPPLGRLQSGQAVEAMALVKNTGQCTARDLSVALEGLPEAFTRPPAQTINELVPGGVRYVTFNLLIPPGYRGEPSFWVQVSEETGGHSQSMPASFSVAGVPVVWTTVIGVLAVLAVVAIVAGILLYVRSR